MSEKVVPSELNDTHDEIGGCFVSRLDQRAPLGHVLTTKLKKMACAFDSVELYNPIRDSRNFG